MDAATRRYAVTFRRKNGSYVVVIARAESEKAAIARARVKNASARNGTWVGIKEYD